MKKLRGVFVNQRQRSVVAHSGSAYNAPTLFELCLDYVAENLSQVENLLNFPDVIGLKIFHTAASKDMFYSYARTAHVKAMQLFCDAYKEQMLSELNASEKWWLSENMLKALSVFVNIRILDLSSCQIGGRGSQMGPMLSKFNCLEELSLHNNGLSNWDLRCLTAASRIVKKCVCSMKKLDLSCNPALTDECASFLVCYKSLEYLDLSGTGFQDSGTKILEKKMNLATSSTSTERTVVCRTTGLAAGIVQQWLEQGRPRTKGEVLAASMCLDGGRNWNATSFYGCTSTESTDPTKSKPPYKPVILLHRSHEGCPNAYSQLSKKRDKFSTEAAVEEIMESDDIKASGTPRKSFSNGHTQNFNQFVQTTAKETKTADWNLLQSYLTPVKSSSHSSLFSAMSSDSW